MVIDFDKVQWAILTKNAIFINIKFLKHKETRKVIEIKRFQMKAVNYVNCFSLMGSSELLITNLFYNQFVRTLNTYNLSSSSKNKILKNDSRMS